MNKQTQHVLGRIVFWFLYALIVFWMLFPFYWAINSSSNGGQLQMTPATFVPRDPETQSTSRQHCRTMLLSSGTSHS